MVEGHRDRQRDHILDVALELLRERGMAALTMTAIAERAGMSRPTLYHYFADIDAVLAAWVGRQIERSVSVMLAEAEAIADPLDRLSHLIQAQATTFASQDHRISAEHFESEAGSPSLRHEVASQMAPLRRTLADTIAEAGTLGQLRTDIEPALAADLVLGLLGALRRHLVAGSIGPDAAVTAVTGLLSFGWFDPTPDRPGRRPSPRRRRSG